MKRKAQLLLAIPLLAILMVCDALAAAWVELADDWRSAIDWFKDEWREP